MTGTPPSFAETPRIAAEPDVLSEVLRAVRLSGAIFLNGRFTAPFAVWSPQRFYADAPMAHLRHTSAFHYIAVGGCTIETASGTRRNVAAGDLILLPFADRHKFEDGATPDMVPTAQLNPSGPTEGIWRVDHGGGGSETRMVCGFLELAEMMSSPVFRTLPEILVERVVDKSLSASLSATVGDLLARTDATTPGTEAILSRMMELLFVEMLRGHASRLPDGSKGLLAALRDPIVGRALRLLHADPARRWTTESLAREAGSSRTVLGEHFNALLGKPPIEYLTGWRIQLAADRLRNGRDGIARIAADIGYESEAGFSRAFKRVTGMTPGRWRDGGGDSPELMPLQFEKPLVPENA